jgi:hypothetical protein
MSNESLRTIEGNERQCRPLRRQLRLILQKVLCWWVSYCEAVSSLASEASRRLPGDKPYGERRVRNGDPEITNSKLSQ